MDGHLKSDEIDAITVTADTQAFADAHLAAMLED